MITDQPVSQTPFHETLFGKVLVGVLIGVVVAYAVKEG